jgi:hypothetical protein
MNLTTLRQIGFQENLKAQRAFECRWLGVFCNSHRLTQLAAFFIDLWAEWSTACSRVCLSIKVLKLKYVPRRIMTLTEVVVILHKQPSSHYNLIAVLSLCRSAFHMWITEKLSEIQLRNKWSSAVLNMFSCRSFKSDRRWTRKATEVTNQHQQHRNKLDVCSSTVDDCIRVWTMKFAFERATSLLIKWCRTHHSPNREEGNQETNFKVLCIQWNMFFISDIHVPPQNNQSVKVRKPFVDETTILHQQYWNRSQSLTLCVWKIAIR